VSAFHSERLVLDIGVSLLQLFEITKRSTTTQGVWQSFFDSVTVSSGDAILYVIGLPAS